MWKDLEEAHCEGDRLSVLVADSKTGLYKLIDCHIYGVYMQGDVEFEEEKVNWPEEFFTNV